LCSILKIVIPIFIALCFVFQSASKLVIVLKFNANKEYIAKNLCVNRNKPKSCCEGKCELKKQLEENDKKTTQSSNTIKDKYEKDELYQSNLKIGLFSNEQKSVKITLASVISNGSKLKIFHPPDQAALIS
jgi:hypothetical protein